MTETKPVIFIRHKLSNRYDILTYLWDNRKIGIHYENVKSIDPKDYSESIQRGVKPALNRFKECREKGAIIVAVYRQLHRNKLLLGEIEEGTKIEYEELEYKNEKLIFKTMQLKNVEELHYIKYPILGAIQPRGSTIVNLRKYGKVIRQLFNEKELPDTVYSLAPEQLEVLCYEFLKRKDMIESLLLPIGRNHLDI